jgi:hypothetical protein
VTRKILGKVPKDCKVNYACVFEEMHPDIKLKIDEPEVFLYAKNDTEALKFVIQEVLHESGGINALLSMAVYKITKSGRVLVDRWKRGPGWEAPGAKGFIGSVPP